jgi:nucleoside-diphosphate-sugar epimerase
VALNPARSPVTGTVVVTGADGFAGRAACAHLRASGIPFRGLVRALSPSTAARPDMLPVGDLVTIPTAALANALRDARAVVHLAARAHAVRDDAADPLAAFRSVNVAATERLARAAAAADIAHFVFASSVKVNGESAPPERPFRESDPPDPRDVYALSKWEAECVLGDVARETGMPVTVLRLPLMYGPGAKGNVARLTDAIARGLPLPLARIDNLRSMLGAGNFASALDALLGAPAPAPGTVATYLVADTSPVSTPEFVRAIASALGVTARLVPVPPWLLQMACACVGKASAFERLAGSLVVDASAFRAAFGWQPPRLLAEELADMARARYYAAAPPL